MAIVKYGSIITEIKGKIGGQVFQGGNQSFVMRNDYKDRNRKSYTETPVNVRYSELAALWKSIGYDNQQSWIDNPNAYLFPVINKFSESIVVCGYDVFCMLNYPLLLFGITTQDICPVDTGTPELINITTDIDIANTKFNIVFDHSPIDNDMYVLFWVTGPYYGIFKDVKKAVKKIIKWLSPGDTTPKMIWDDYYSSWEINPDWVIKHMKHL